ncbi:MAG: hypothetical protein H7263_01055 [Candidatus Sericytochromatia bacterium]|nr:hypothetical protein [Candidatus Sericytochromatia bacterium]
MKNIKNLIPIIPFLFIIACQPDNAIIPSVNPSASSSTAISDDKKNGVLVVEVVDGLTQKAVINATAKIVVAGNTVTKQTDTSGKASFEGLTEGSNYNVQVSSEGYQINSQSTASSKLVIKAQSPAVLTIKLYKNIGSFTGRVISNTGLQVDSAVVSVGDNSGITDSTGHFKVNISNLTSQNVTVAKMGFKLTDYGSVDFSKQANITTGDIKLSPTNTPYKVMFDTSKSPFGDVQGDKTSISNLSTLNNTLSSLKFMTTFEDFTKKSSLDDIDIIVLPSPSIDYSSVEVEQLTNFVKSGKKLIILGEWGGYGGFKSDSINKLLKASNLRINPDVVKDGSDSNNEDIISTKINQHFLTKGVSRLSFFSTASVEVVEGGIKSVDNTVSQLLAYSNNSSFRIQAYNAGQFGLVGVSTIGAGKVVAIGDSSIFLDIDSVGDGKYNINRDNNLKLATNMFNW